MKNLFILIIMAFVAFSCSKDEQAALVNTLLPEKFTATITDSTGTATEWSAITRVTKKTSKGFSIVGTSTSGIIELSTVGHEAKTYALSLSIDDSTGLSANCGGFYKESISVNPSDFYMAKKGTLNISKINDADKTLTGTFSFTMYKIKYTTIPAQILDSVVVSNGSFADIKYSEGD